MAVSPQQYLCFGVGQFTDAADVTRILPMVHIHDLWKAPFQADVPGSDRRQKLVHLGRETARQPFAYLEKQACEQDHPCGTRRHLGQRFARGQPLFSSDRYFGKAIGEPGQQGGQQQTGDHDSGRGFIDPEVAYKNDDRPVPKVQGVGDLADPDGKGMGEQLSGTAAAAGAGQHHQGRAHAGQQRGVAWKGGIAIKPKVRQDDAADPDPSDHPCEPLQPELGQWQQS